MILANTIRSVLLFSVVSWALIGHSDVVEAKQAPVLLVSLDGMRASALDQHLKENPNSNFKRIIDKGLKADYMTPIFPSLTFPNHWTLVTGVYAEVHGIVSNTVYDPRIDVKMSLLTGSTSTDPFWWNTTEAIWTTARKKSMKTAASFWPGSASWPNTPDFFLSYSSTYSYYSRIDELMSWFVKFGLDFACIYFDEPDHEGHNSGPDTQEYRDKIKYMDSVIGYFLDALEKNKLLDKINLIVVGDHGMETSDRAPTNIISYIDESLFDHQRSVVSFASNIYPKDDSKVNELYEALKAVPNSEVYLKKDVPTRYHYSNNPRIGPIVLIADHGYLIADGSWAGTKGSHGYDNRIETMRTIFMARGPNFKEAQTMAGIDNIHVHPLMCRLLGLDYSHSNGSSKIFDQYLRSFAVRLDKTNLAYVISFLFVFIRMFRFDL